MSRETLDTAVKLLTKARSTTSPHEAIALVERSYGLLAQVINAYDDAVAAGPRRRERRRIYDRRRRARTDGGRGEARSASPAGADSLARYGVESAPGVSKRRRIDVVL